MTDDPQQDRVKAYADAILNVLAGVENTEAQTALVIAVASIIIALYPESEWPTAIRGFAAEVANILKSRDHVAFLKSAIKPTPAGGHA